MRELSNENEEKFKRIPLYYLLKSMNPDQSKSEVIHNDRIEVRNDGARLDEPIHVAQIDEFFIVYAKIIFLFNGARAQAPLSNSTNEKVFSN
jgi:hypothetical protein